MLIRFQQSVIRFSGTFAAKNVLGIKSHEHATATGEQNAFGVAEFGNSRQAAATLRDFMRFHAKRCVQGYWTKIFNRHARGGCGQITQLIQLAHRVIENGCDDSAVAVTGRAGVAIAQSEITNVFPPACVGEKFQVHPAGIICAAGKTVVFAP